ncbi:MAG TPA: hypothetical protein VD863_11825 [Bradyrhizobium sp.]|jgi:hypothetical protein|nr:hypothetical protein [Bradyrhizobium sp.]
MVYELQFVAIAAFLIWCLVSSLSGLLAFDPDEARLVWRERRPCGWDGWREAHFGLTAADRRLLTQPEPLLDPQKRASLLDTVMQQDRHPDAEAVQFAVVRMSADRDQARAVFISDQIAIASANLILKTSVD